MKQSGGKLPEIVVCVGHVGRDVVMPVHQNGPRVNPVRRFMQRRFSQRCGNERCAGGKQDERDQQ